MKIKNLKFGDILEQTSNGDVIYIALLSKLSNKDDSFLCMIIENFIDTGKIFLPAGTTVLFAANYDYSKHFKLKTKEWYARHKGA